MTEMTRDIDDKKEEKQERRAGRIEWVIGIVSSLVVAALVAFLVYQGSSGAGSQPALRVEVERSVDFPETGHVRFTVFNSGDKAASHVVVSAVERAADGTVAEKQSIEIDYVPANSEQSGGFYVDPDAELVFSVEGYADP